MKTLTIHTYEVSIFERNIYRQLIGLVALSSLLFVLARSLINGFNAVNLMFAVAVLLTFPVLLRMMKSRSESTQHITIDCVLEFGDRDLICKVQNTMKWRIPYVEITHLETREVGSGKWFAPKRRQTMLCTNRKSPDSHSLFGTIKAEDQILVEEEIKTHKEGSKNQDDSQLDMLK